MVAPLKKGPKIFRIPVVNKRYEGTQVVVHEGFVYIDVEKISMVGPIEKSSPSKDIPTMHYAVVVDGCFTQLEFNMPENDPDRGYRYYADLLHIWSNRHRLD